MCILCISVYACMHGYSQIAEEGIWLSGAGISSDFEGQIWVPIIKLQSSLGAARFLTTESSL